MNDLSAIIRANKEMQRAIKKAKADAAMGELRCFPKEAFIAAKIGIPIPAISIIVANDNILTPPAMFDFFSIILTKTFVIDQ